jgi:RimJ/RimL family protein N-acetyltransferase
MRAAVVKLHDYLWRPLTASESDTDFVVAMRNAERFRPWFYNMPVTRETHRTFMQRADDRGEINWLVEHKDQPVGLASVYNIDAPNRKAECGRIAAIDPKVFQLNWIVSACIGMDVLGVNKLYIETLEENRIIARGVERMGMIKEGLLRHHVIRDGVPLNVLVFSNTKAEWDEMRDRQYAKWGTPEVISFEGQTIFA